MIHSDPLDPEPGLHTLGDLAYYRLLALPTSLQNVADEIVARRAGGSGPKFGQCIIVLPYGTCEDRYAGELYDLTLLDIDVMVDGTTALVELIAGALADARGR